MTAPGEQTDNAVAVLRSHTQGLGLASYVEVVAAALESARADTEVQRARAEVAERRCWAVRPGSRAGDIECCLRRGHDGDHWATTGCAGSEITWPRIEAERDAERAKVQDYSERIDAAIEWARADADNYDMTGLFHALRLFREDSAALAAAQPTGKTP